MILTQLASPNGELIDCLFHDNEQAQQHSIARSQIIIHKKKLRLSPLQIKKILLETLEQLNNHLGLQVTLAQSINHLKIHATRSCYRAIFRRIHDSIHRGKSLHQALTDIGIPFSHHHVQLIRHGEANNQLSATLNLLIDELKSELNQRKKIRKAMSYPYFLMSSCYLFIHFVLLNLMPNMLELYQNIGKSAPAWLQRLSHPIFFLSIADCLTAGIILYFLLPRFFSSKSKLKTVFYRIPIIHQFMLTKGRLNWLSGFLIEHKTHALLLTAFHTAIDCVTLPALRHALHTVCEKIRRGYSPANALQESGLFPADWILIFDVGEKNNRLNELCSQLIIQQNNLWQEKITFLISLIEPITLLLMGGIVLFLIVALYAPLLSVYSSAG